MSHYWLMMAGDNEPLDKFLGSEFDHYEQGGRWANCLLLKNGNYADKCLKKDIDIDTMRKKAEAYARKLHQKVHSLYPDGKIPAFSTWHEVYNKPNASELYFTQPAVNTLHETFDHRFSLDDFLVTEDEYASRIKRQAVTPDAFLSEGNWRTVVDDEYKWATKFMELFDALPDDTLITIIDYHI